MAEHPEEKQNSNGLFALFTGAVIGVLSGIFLAGLSGEKTSAIKKVLSAED